MSKQNGNSDIFNLQVPDVQVGGDSTDGSPKKRVAASNAGSPGLKSNQRGGNSPVRSPGLRVNVKASIDSETPGGSSPSKPRKTMVFKPKPMKAPPARQAYAEEFADTEEQSEKDAHIVARNISLAEQQQLKDSYDEEIYRDEPKILGRGITLPNTGKGTIDRDKLTISLARGTCEMAYNVNEGTFPIFGYPLVCYSPEAGAEKSDFWTVMYKSAMKRVKAGQENEIGQLLEAYDEFCIKNDNLEREFAKGRIFGKKGSQQATFEDVVEGPVAAEAPKPKRGAKERPEESPQHRKEEKYNIYEYKSDLTSVMEAMRQHQKDLVLEEKRAKKEERQRQLALSKKKKGEQDSLGDYDDPDNTSPNARSHGSQQPSQRVLAISRSPVRNQIAIGKQFNERSDKKPQFQNQSMINSQSQKSIKITPRGNKKTASNSHKLSPMTTLNVIKQQSANMKPLNSEKHEYVRGIPRQKIASQDKHLDFSSAVSSQSPIKQQQYKMPVVKESLAVKELDAQQLVQESQSRSKSFLNQVIDEDSAENATFRKPRTNTASGADGRSQSKSSIRAKTASGGYSKRQQSKESKIKRSTNESVNLKSSASNIQVYIQENDSKTNLNDDYQPKMQKVKQKKLVLPPNQRKRLTQAREEYRRPVELEVTESDRMHSQTKTNSHTFLETNAYANESEAPKNVYRTLKNDNSLKYYDSHKTLENSSIDAYPVHNSVDAQKMKAIRLKANSSMDIYGNDIEQQNILMTKNRQKRTNGGRTKHLSKGYKSSQAAAFTYMTQVHHDVAGLKSDNDSKLEDRRAQHPQQKTVSVVKNAINILPTIRNLQAPNGINQHAVSIRRQSCKKKSLITKKMSQEIGELNLFSEGSTHMKSISSMHQSLYNSLAKTYKVDQTLASQAQSQNSLNHRSAPRKVLDPQQMVNSLAQIRKNSSKKLYIKSFQTQYSNKRILRDSSDRKSLDMYDAKDLYGNGSQKSMYTIDQDFDNKNGRRFI